MSAGEDARVGSGGRHVRVVLGHRAIKIDAEDFSARVTQRLSLVVRVVAVLAEIGVLVVLTGGDVEHPFLRMGQQSATHVLTGLVAFPLHQRRLAGRVDS